MKGTYVLRIKRPDGSVRTEPCEDVSEANRSAQAWRAHFPRYDVTVVELETADD